MEKHDLIVNDLEQMLNHHFKDSKTFKYIEYVDDKDKVQGEIDLLQFDNLSKSLFYYEIKSSDGYYNRIKADKQLKKMINETIGYSNLYFGHVKNVFGIYVTENMMNRKLMVSKKILHKPKIKCSLKL